MFPNLCENMLKVQVPYNFLNAGTIFFPYI